ncbi:unnamed protein product [Brugia pahangi]|uniref:Zinc finger protein n=1 Tax=Brugia pahangi TaxID=6280 RepID=A0A0N4T3X0_BRUPA|nr:unnamed protein product [Brugia pahangi]
MPFIYLFLFVFQLSNIRNTVAQTEQTEPLDLSISKVKEEGNKSQGLSVERVSDERIKPRRQLVPIETLMKVIEPEKESTGKKRRCDICQKEITHMKKHVMTHTGEKPYSCPVCKRNFTQFGHNQKHMMTHTGEKPYSCSICKKNFSRSDSMKTHMMTHTGEKPYSCSICGKSYKQKCTLQSHMVTHEINRPVYHCTVCSKDFQTKCGLKLHMKNH